MIGVQSQMSAFLKYSNFLLHLGACGNGSNWGFDDNGENR